MAIATVNLKFGVNVDSFRQGIGKIEAEMSKIGSKMQSVGRSLSLGVTLPVAAIGAASLKAASDAEETFSKFDTVFRDIQGTAEQAFQTLRKEYGLSSTAAKQMLGDTGDLLTGFGFSQQGALELSMEVQKLAVDLASFTNYSGGAKGASEALTKALLGEREQLKSLGIAIMEEDVKRQVALNTKNGIIFATEREAKAHATLQLAISQSGNAIGDYARTSDSFANQSRLLRARLEDISVELGQVFLPLATKLINVVSGAVNWFTQLDSSVKTVIAVVAALAAAVGPLLVGLGFLVSNIIPMLKAGWIAVSAAMTPLVLKIAAITAAVAGLILVGKGVYDSWGTVSAFFSQMWDKVKIAFIKGIAATLKTFNKFTTIIGLDFSDTVAKMEADAKGIQTALDAQPVVTFGDVVSDIGTNIMKTFTDIKSAVSGTKDEVIKTNNALAQTQATTAGGIGGGGAATPALNRPTDEGISAPSRTVDMAIRLPDQLKGVADRVREAAVPIWGAAQELTDTFGAILTSGASNGIASMGAALGSAFASGTSVVKALGSALLGAIGQIATELGKAAIAIGVGMIAIKKAFSNPYTAIAAGIALVALGAFINTKVSQMTSGGGAGGGGGALGPASSMPARAMGGSVQMGQPYLVGERGPELFTPSGFGNITNARNTAMMGGGVQTIHIMGELKASGRDLAANINEYVRVSGRTT